MFLLRQFISTLPIEMDEAAKIEGCGTLASTGVSFCPLIKPALAAVSIFVFLVELERHLLQPYLSQQPVELDPGARTELSTPLQPYGPWRA